MNKEECIKTIQYHLIIQRYDIEKKVEELKANDRHSTTYDYILQDMDQAIKYLKENLK